MAVKTGQNKKQHFKVRHLEEQIYLNMHSLTVQI